MRAEQLQHDPTDPQPERLRDKHVTRLVGEHRAVDQQDQSERSEKLPALLTSTLSRRALGPTSVPTTTSTIHAGETTSGTPKMRPAGIPAEPHGAVAACPSRGSARSPINGRRARCDEPEIRRRRALASGPCPRSTLVRYVGDRRARVVAVAVTRAGLQELRLALSASGSSTGCPSRRASTPRAAPSSTAYSSGSSICRRRADASRPRRTPTSSRAGRRCSRGRAELAALVDERAGRPRRTARRRPASCSTATSRSRIPAGSSRPSARCWSRRRCLPASISRGSSTGSTARPPATCGSSTTRAASRPASRSRARRCSSSGSTRWCCGAPPACCRKLLRLYYLRGPRGPRLHPRRGGPRLARAPARGDRDGDREGASTGDWRHKPSKLCNWCSFHAFCPEFGGVPPELPLPQERQQPIDLDLSQAG